MGADDTPEHVVARRIHAKEAALAQQADAAGQVDASRARERLPVASRPLDVLETRERPDPVALRPIHGRLLEHEPVRRIRVLEAGKRERIELHRGQAAAQWTPRKAGFGPWVVRG